MIRIRETGALVTEQEFRDSHPLKSFPDPLRTEDLDGNGADIVFEGPQPIASQYQSVVPSGVVQINGNWHTAYTLWDWEPDRISAAQTEAKDAQIIDLKKQISTLEADFQPRFIREALLTGDTARLKDLDKKISDIRDTLRPLLPEPATTTQQPAIVA